MERSKILVATDRRVKGSAALNRADATIKSDNEGWNMHDAALVPETVTDRQ
jgi:hypothetical protein